MTREFADRFYVDEAIEKVDAHNHALDAMAYALSSAHYGEVEKYITKTLKEKAFPKIWGKPTRFSLWWRRIKIEKRRINAYRTQITILQGKKILANKIVGLI